jgi:hypothetical protein
LFSNIAPTYFTVYRNFLEGLFLPFAMARDTSILLVGCGAVGTICAVSLERSKKAAVTAILRSQYQAVKNNGFTINSIDHGELTGWKPSHGKGAFFN